MTPEETKEFIDKNFDEIVNRYIAAVVERGKETKGPEFKLTNDLREKVNDFVNETIEIFKNNLGDAGQVSVEDFIEFVKDRFEAAGSPDVIDTLLDEYKEDDDLDVDDIMRRAAAEDENEYDRNTYGDNTKTDAVSTIVAPMVNLAKKKLKEKLVEFMIKKAAEKFGNLSDDVIDDIAGYIKQLADVCNNDEQTMKIIFNEGYGSIPSYKDALNWILEKGTSEDLKAEGENLFSAVKKPCLDAAEGAEDDQEFRQMVIGAISPIDGPERDKYIDIVVDLSKRAIEKLSQEDGDGYEAKFAAIDAAMDEGWTDQEDQLTVMKYILDLENHPLDPGENPEDYMVYEGACEHLFEDIRCVLSVYNGKDPYPTVAYI